MVTSFNKAVISFNVALTSFHITVTSFRTIVTRFCIKTRKNLCSLSENCSEFKIYFEAGAEFIR